jgi:hypothetical protein
MANTIEIRLRGWDRLAKAMKQHNLKFRDYLIAGLREQTKETLNTVGLQRYPSETAANKPPVPFYVRGIGTQTAAGNKGGSQRLGTQFFTKKKDKYGIIVGNRASYSPYVVGSDQAKHMEPKGWRKLFEVIKEQLPDYVMTLQKWMGKLIRDVGL